MQGASSSTGTLPEKEELWRRLPEELLLKVLVELEWWTRRDLGAVRGVCRTWRAVHDDNCKTLRVRDGMTDEMMHALCGRLPAVTRVILVEVWSLTSVGVSAMSGLAALTELCLCSCKVTNVLLHELTYLTKLTCINLDGCRISRAGRVALKAAIPGLTISTSDDA